MPPVSVAGTTRSGLEAAVLRDGPSESTAMLESLRGNVRKFYVYRLFMGLSAYVWIPISLLYFVDRGVSITQFMVLWSLFSVSVLVFEIPTGVLADRISRKWSLVAGVTLTVCALVVFLYSSSFPLLAVGYLIFGLGHALTSGADLALLYDSLKISGREDSFRRVIGTALTWQLSGQVAGPLIIGVVVGIGGLSWTLVAGLVFNLVAAPVAASLVDPPTIAVAGPLEASIRSKLGGNLHHLKSSLGIVARNRQLLAIVVIGIVIFDFTELTKRPFVQPYLVAFGFSAGQIGYLYSLFVAAAAVVAKFSHRLDEAFGSDERKVMTITFAVAIGGLLALANATVTWVAVAAVFVMFSLDWGLREPVIQTSLNRRVPSEYRAACLSIVNMTFSFVTIFTGPLFGFLVDEYSLRTGLSIFQFTFGPLLLAAVILAWLTLRPVANGGLGVNRPRIGGA